MSRKFSFKPILTTNRNEDIEYIEYAKLLGVIISNDLSTKRNMDLISNKCYRSIWIIPRLKNLGCPMKELLDIRKE